MDYLKEYLKKLKAMDIDTLENSIKKEIEEIEKIKVIDFKTADKHSGHCKDLYRKMQILTIKQNKDK